jgi:hypothetical protein
VQATVDNDLPELEKAIQAMIAVVDSEPTADG